MYFFADGHHKLIRWKIVTHAGIDGFSRLIVYLKCSTNNRASTVYELFLKAVHKYHLPSRVCSDEGGENVLVAQHMLEHRGPGRGSMLTGSSVHNQRIERLWRDLHSGVTRLFYRLFYYLEEHELLNISDELQLYSLHYVYLPRINKALDEFRSTWNHHRMRTTHNKSPQQLFTAGLLLLQHSQLTAMDYFESIDDFYGRDEDGPESDDNEGTVVVSQLRFQVQPAVLQQLQSINPLGLSNSYGIDIKIL